MAKKTRCIAHRGGPQGNALQENSLAAIEQSLNLNTAGRKVDAIEIDLWQHQGELLIVHDRRLGRVLPGKERLLDLSVDELQARALAANTPIATLEQVVALTAGRALLNIEIKGPNVASTLCKQLSQWVEQGRAQWRDFIVSSFDHRQLEHCLTAVPQLPRGLLSYGIDLHLAEPCVALEAQVMCASIDFINRELVRDCHQRGLECWVYTANEIDDLEMLLDLEVDGIFTDYPERLLGLLNS